MPLFLTLLIAALLLAFIGVTAAGLSYLVFIAGAVLAADIAYASVRLRKGKGRHRTGR
ncbi:MULTISPECIES: hypothetical protein [unclassified Streptomyces]|uniref:hypothetical protein n=1 Tax=unclassified Streptomyces TaxID=2593676 RepID=UPI0038059F52